MRRLRNGGQSSRYHHDERGVNSRLDELQAAILRARLTGLPAATAARRRLAARYRAALTAAPVEVPPECDAGHVYHLFPVLTAARDRFQDHLRAGGVETLVHYPVPIPRQPAARIVDAGRLSRGRRRLRPRRVPAVVPIPGRRRARRGRARGAGVLEVAQCAF